jgi:purine-binding chemotaxis protein CheW
VANLTDTKLSAPDWRGILEIPAPVRLGHGGARAEETLEGSNMESVVIDRETAVVSKNDDHGGKYLVFELGREEFGIRVLKVREIMGIQEITAVPQTAAHVKGVINLRGKVIPVVDLRLKFGMPEQQYTQRSCIIVVQVRGEAGPMLMGIVVDGVAEVLNLVAADIEDTPDFGQGATTSYLLGMAKVKGKVKILLDIDQVLTSQELHGLESVLS